MSRPQPVGELSVAKKLRSVLFSEVILGAASVRPRGLTKKILLSGLHWLGPFLARNATGPLPALILYLAVTPVDIRIFGKPGLSDPFEIGRWKKGTYLASVKEHTLNVELNLELERLGRISLLHTRFDARRVRPVFDLVVLGAAGPST